jgi:hypothetical protein
MIPKRNWNAIQIHNRSFRDQDPGFRDQDPDFWHQNPDFRNQDPDFRNHLWGYILDSFASTRAGHNQRAAGGSSTLSYAYENDALFSYAYENNA